MSSNYSNPNQAYKRINVRAARHISLVLDLYNLGINSFSRKMNNDG